MKTETQETAAVQKASPAHTLRYDALLVFITMIWGSTFLVVKYVVKLSGPFTYLAFAYGIGALTLALIFHRRLAVHGVRAANDRLTIYHCQQSWFHHRLKCAAYTGFHVPIVEAKSLAWGS